MRIRTSLFLFVPAIAVAVFALFVSFIQYQPKKILYNDPNRLEILNIVPIFNEDIILGNLKAPKTIIAFEDLGCARCQDQMEMFEELLTKFPDKIKIILKTLNVTTFPESSAESHQYLFCAYKQNKYKEFKDALFVEKLLDTNSLKYVSEIIELDAQKLEECLAGAEVANYTQKNEEMAKNLMIESTPTIFVDNKIIQEPLNITGWETILSLTK